MTDALAHHGNLVNSLRSALAEGEHGLGTVPDLLSRVCDEGSWREFVTPMGELVRHDSWATFVTMPPLKGLGTSDKTIDRLLHDRPEVRRKVDVARKGKPGRPRKGLMRVESTRIRGAEDSAITAQRLAEQHPDEYAAVERGEKTLNRAARDAGIRRPRIMVRLDDAQSAAATLRKHMPSDVLEELKALL